MVHFCVAYTKCHPHYNAISKKSEQSLPKRPFKETKMAMNDLQMQCSCKRAIVGMKTLTNNTSFMVVYLPGLVLGPVIFVLFCLFKGFSLAKMSNTNYQFPASATRYFSFHPTSNASAERASFRLAFKCNA